MEEDEFRRTYEAIRELPCAFEKAVLGRHCGCAMARRFNLGEREGVVCTDWPAQQNCMHLLELLRENARFALGLTGVPGPLPHGREMKVQVGGLQGLLRVMEPGAGPVEDVNALVSRARDAYGGLERAPFQEIIKSVAAYKGRRRSSRRS